MTRIVGKGTALMGDRGDWIQTSSGRKFFPFDPRPEEIFIEDIAAGLSRQCRFGGQLRRGVEFYSTAEHSIALARHFRDRGESRLAKWALMHDAPEAYLNELVTPIKRRMPAYREVETRLMWEICGKFGLDFEEPQEVRDADRRIVSDERHCVMAEPPAPWTDEKEPIGAIIVCYPPIMAYHAFLLHFQELFGAA